ncbi:MAG: preprotein translocase subunit SecY, partial [Bacteroidales bacterium]|nr:preprotein translocase subunit SecY [Bacteroidales bacterium]
MSKLRQILSDKNLKKRILYTILILVFFRFLAHIPVPGVSLDELRKLFNQNQLFGLLNLFTGGAMRNFSIVMMGVGPYITSSIIFQLLTIIVPYFEQLSHEGEYGKQKINHYTRLATIPLALLQSYSMIALLKNQGVVFDLNTFQLIITIITLSAGTVLVMWLGELISENGIGNGISLIIALGIIANVPLSIAQTITIGDTSQIIGLIGILAASIVVIASIIYVTEGERRIPVTYARRIRGHRTYGQVDTHLPIKVNIGGVIPIIFALSVMIVPGMLAKFFVQARSETIASIAKWVENIFQNNLIYGIIYFVLVIAFSFFYASVVFQPKQVAENLQKQGGFIPGLRPGKETESYLG